MAVSVERVVLYRWPPTSKTIIELLLDEDVLEGVFVEGFVSAGVLSDIIVHRNENIASVV